MRNRPSGRSIRSWRPPLGPSCGTRERTVRSWLLKIALEVVLISVGVFLALMGEQWRESAHTRELAEASLRGFRSEILANRKAVAAVKDYHLALLESLRAYLAADTKTRNLASVRIQGLQPVFFEHTAWDLALATQSLAHIDGSVAFGLSRVYGLQRTYAEMTGGIMQAIYLRPMTENFEGLTAYYGDLVLWEPELLRMYEELLPQIDRALGESPAQGAALAFRTVVVSGFSRTEVTRTLTDRSGGTRRLLSQPSNGVRQRVVQWSRCPAQARCAPSRCRTRRSVRESAARRR